MNEMKRTGNFISDTARALFDGGWRSEDWIELIDEYNFSLEEIYDICSELDLLEREEDNDKTKNSKFDDRKELIDECNFSLEEVYDICNELEREDVE